VLGPEVFFGYGRNQYDTPGAHVGIDAEGVWGPIRPALGRWTYYRLFAERPGGEAASSPQSKARRKKRESPTRRFLWTRTVPVIVRAMLLAGDKLFVAGPADPLGRLAKSIEEVDQLAAALATDRGGRLLAIDPADGKTLADYKLPSQPVFDGMAAAYGCLFICARDGSVACWRPAK